MSTDPFRDYEVTSISGGAHRVNNVTLYITESGTLVFRDEDDELIESYSATGWVRVVKK